MFQNILAKQRERSQFLRAGNGSVRQRSRVRAAGLDDAKAGAAQRRVYAQNNPMKRSFGPASREQNSGQSLARFAAQRALSWLFKLAKRDAPHVYPCPLRTNCESKNG